MPTRCGSAVLAAVLLLAASQPTPAGPARADDYGDPLPEGAVARIGTVRFRHGGLVLGIAYSPDGAVIASGGQDHKVRLWEATTGREVRCLDAPTGFAVQDVAFSCDGRLVAAGCGQGFTYVWHARTGRLLHRLGSESDDQGQVAFSPDGKALATSAGKAVRVWDTVTWDERVRLEDDQGTVQSITFTPDGAHIATAASDSTVRLWHIGKRRLVRRLRGHGELVNSVAVSPDGGWLASAWTDDGSIILWDARTGEQRWTARLPGGPCRRRSSVRFSQDGRLLAAASDGGLTLLDVGTGKWLCRFAAAGDDFRNIAFSPTGRTLAAACYSAVRLFDVPRGQEIIPAEGQHRDVYSVAFCPGGRLLAAASGCQVRVYDPATRREVQRLEGEHLSLLEPQFSLDGRRLVTDGVGGHVRIWDVGDWKLVREWGGPADPRPVVDRLLTPDLRTLILQGPGSRPGPCDLRVCDARTDRELRRLADTADREARTACSPDSRLLAFWEHKGPTRVFDLGSGREVRRFGDGQATDDLRFAPDSRSVGVSDNFGTIRVWEVSSARLRCRVAGHRGWVHFAFSVDGGLLATWPQEGPALLWQLSTGAVIGRLGGHRGKVWDVAFSPDGALVASASADSTVLLWDLCAVTGAGPRRRATLAARDLDRLWADLAGADAARAYLAIGALRDSPAQAVPYLAGRLRPVRGSGPGAVNRLLAELDAEDFATRERAARELDRQAEVVTPRLRQALEAGPSPEARRRLERIVAKLDKAPPEPETLRELRAIEALEAIGTTAAQKVLQAMARGEPGARLTDEAKSSLARLARRP
jgi:WD40 repeat protein